MQGVKNPSMDFAGVQNNNNFQKPAGGKFYYDNGVPQVPPGFNNNMMNMPGIESQGLNMPVMNANDQQMFMNNYNNMMNNGIMTGTPNMIDTMENNNKEGNNQEQPNLTVEKEE